MNREKVYQFNEYVLGYDKGEKDRSCLAISKIQNDTMYVMSSLYDESAEIVSMILDNLQAENKRLHSIIKEVREYIEERYNGEVLTHTFDKDNVGELLEILKGSE